VLPTSYQDILDGLADASEPLRAKYVDAAAGLSPEVSKVEGLRSKLKRLVEREWLIEDGPGRFTVIRRTACARTRSWYSVLWP
jgi:hypothetical protein